MTLIVTISGNPVTISEKSIDAGDNIDGRSTLKFDVLDPTGTNHYQFAQPVTLTDTISGYTFTGYINDVIEKNQNPNTNMIYTVTCVDGEYIPGKRFYVGPEYTNTYAGDIVVDLVNRELSAEGITTAYAVDSDRSQREFSDGTLTGLSALNNISGGDLELTSAGTQVQIIESTTANFAAGSLTGVTAVNNTLVPVSTPAIKLSGTMNTPGLSGTIAVYKIWSGSYVIQSNDFLEYYIWIDPTSPEIKASVDLVFTDGTSLSSLATNYNVDGNGFLPVSSTDLAGYADGNWYYRQMGIANFAGKTIAYATVCLGGSKNGDYKAYFKNIDIHYTQISLNIFSGTLQASQQLQIIGYSNISVLTVATYDLPLQPTGYSKTRISPAYNISPANTIKNSFISWNATTPLNTYVDVRCYINNGYPIICQNNSKIPVLLTGMSAANSTLTITQRFLRLPGASPEVAPTLNNLEVTINPSYACIKQDITYATSFSLNEANAIFTNTNTNNAMLNIAGATYNWDNAQYPVETEYFNSPVGPQIVKRQYIYVNLKNNNEAKTRFDFAGQFQDFTAEIDVQIQTDLTVLGGLFYRSTNLSVNAGSFAFAATVSGTALTLLRGTNTTAGGATTTIASVTISLSGGTYHKLKIVAVGTSHKIYLDDILFINATSSNFVQTGYVGTIANTPNTTTYQGIAFDNFGIMAALTGTWISPPIALSAASTYGNSYITWIDGSESPNSSNTVNVLVSIDGGATYAQCTQNAPLPAALFTSGMSLAGKSLLVQVNLLTTTAGKMPGIYNLGLLITGGFSTSGNRTSEALALSPIGRAGSTLVTWNGLVPANTTMAIDTSLDFTNWTQIGTGASGSAPIAGITTQAEPILDKFIIDTSRNYTSTSMSGGTPATATIDTANSRLVLVGGTNALYLYNSPAVASDFDLSAILDRSDSGGFVWRYQDPNNYYDLVIADASAGTNPNTIQVFKTVLGVRTQIAGGANAVQYVPRAFGGTLILTNGNSNIAFTRGTPHTFRVTVMTTSITVSMDGVNVLSFSDPSITTAGYCGLRNSGGTAQYYLFRVQAFGDDVSAKQVYTRVRMTSTDASATPQLVALQASVRSTSIQNGAFIPQTAFSVLNKNKKTVAQIIDDLAKQSNFWWRIVGGKLSFQAHESAIAPWPVTSKDVLSAKVEVNTINDEYRNSMWIGGGKDIVQLAPVSFIGNGFSNSFDVGFPIESISSISVNAVLQSIGIKGADTGKDWYYKQGDSSIVQDANAIRLINTQTLVINCSVQTDITVNVKRDAEITRLAALDNTTGIIEEGEDAKGLNKSAMIVRADGLLTQFAIKNAKKVKFSTLRSGLAVGQLVSLFVSQFGLFDGTFLITNIKTTWKNTSQNGIQITQAWYDVEATSGPIVGDWTRFISNLSQLK